MGYNWRKSIQIEEGENGSLLLCDGCGSYYEKLVVFVGSELCFGVCRDCIEEAVEILERGNKNQ